MFSLERELIDIYVVTFNWRYITTVLSVWEIILHKILDKNAFRKSFIRKLQISAIRFKEKRFKISTIRQVANFMTIIGYISYSHEWICIFLWYVQKMVIGLTIRRNSSYDNRLQTHCYIDFKKYQFHSH